MRPTIHPITYSPMFAHLTGSVTAAVLRSYLSMVGWGEASISYAQIRLDTGLATEQIDEALEIMQTHGLFEQFERINAEMFRHKIGFVTDAQIEQANKTIKSLIKLK